MEVPGQTGLEFFSPCMGLAQRLPNGNTLITELSFGRLSRPPQLRAQTCRLDQDRRGHLIQEHRVLDVLEVSNPE